MTAGSNSQKGPPHKRPHYFLLLVRRVLGRFYTPPIKRDLDIYASIRGQQVDEAREVPVPPLKKTIQI